MNLVYIDLDYPLDKGSYVYIYLYHTLMSGRVHHFAGGLIGVEILGGVHYVTRGEILVDVVDIRDKKIEILCKETSN